MDKYEARQVRMWKGTAEWRVYKDGYQWIAPKQHMTEAEARIIAFALNAVAEGRTLASGWLSQDSLHMSGYSEAVVYDGPTEGVAS